MFLAVSSPSVDPSFFALSTMIRHSVNAFLGQLAQERPMRFELDKIYEATKFLNDFEFPKRLRIGYQTSKWPNFWKYRGDQILQPSSRWKPCKFVMIQI